MDNLKCCKQLVVPKEYVPKVLYLAHSHILGGHLGREKTYERILDRFYWPGVKRAVEDYCRHCAECQINSPKVQFRNTLIPLPIIETPFSRIGMDIVGPLPKSSRGHHYILVILDYANCYPEAIPLRSANAKTVAREMLLLFSRTDGLVERFNKTLKHMLRKVIDVDGKNWDQLLPYVLFSIREDPQGSTGFSPFELLYGRRPRGMLDLAKEAWEEQPSTHRSLVEHLLRLCEQLSAKQVQDLRELLDGNRDVFSETPGRTTVITHDIKTAPGKTVRLRPYRIPEAQRQAIRQEVQKMLDLGVLEESHSAWSSPIVLVGKPDGSIRFCNDYRKVNEIAELDTYPMPRADELVERLGPARFISTLDLTKGYWQVV
ncbi:hypothetical protein ACEWY4_010193 [Coilia grayii]|uniref:Gypsy retrotransposon integrase-like protein 1 n=1 Tax=Coilia grayii TaxID=363190 RepID=A0ABD1K8J1_9TELE